MKRVAFSLVVLVLASAVPARAQDPPPRLPIIVIDLQGSIARFPSDDPLLANSRGITVTELPGSGFGGQMGVHLYPIRSKSISVGIGGQAIIAQARQTPATEVAKQIQAVTEEFRSIGGQLSLNFGKGTGWSYLSGGIGRSNWSIIPGEREALETDNEVLKTINWGGGARWFAKSHLAFSFDVRFYTMAAGTPSLPGKNGSPQTRFMVIGAGISIK